MVKNLLLWLIIATVLYTVFQNFNVQPNRPDLGYTEFLQEVKQDRVRKVVIDGLVIHGELNDSTRFKTIRPNIPDTGLMGDLLDHQVEVEGQEPEQRGQRVLALGDPCDRLDLDGVNGEHSCGEPGAGKTEAQENTPENHCAQRVQDHVRHVVPAGVEAPQRVLDRERREDERIVLR